MHSSSSSLCMKLPLGYPRFSSKFIFSTNGVMKARCSSRLILFSTGILFSTSISFFNRQKLDFISRSSKNPIDIGKNNEGSPKDNPTMFLKKKFIKRDQGEKDLTSIMNILKDSKNSDAFQNPKENFSSYEEATKFSETEQEREVVQQYLADFPPLDDKVINSIKQILDIYKTDDQEEKKTTPTKQKAEEPKKELEDETPLEEFTEDFLKSQPISDEKLSSIKEKLNEEKMGHSLSENEIESLKSLQEGNEAFSKKDWSRAFISYKKSMELDSTNLISRFNAAAIFEENNEDKMALSEYQAIMNQERAQPKPDRQVITECLCRIARIYNKLKNYSVAYKFIAKASTIMPSIPEIQELKNEIEIRLGRIPSHLILSDFDEKYYSQLTSNVNIIVDESSKKGRKVIATDNFKKGEVVFVETPIASFPSPEHSLQFCSHCFQIIPNVEYYREDDSYYSSEAFYSLMGNNIHSIQSKIRENLGLDEVTKPVQCDHCSEIYCSETCKEEAQKEHHSILCTKGDHQHPYYLLKEHARKFGGDTSLFIASILASLTQQPHLVKHVEKLCYSNLRVPLSKLESEQLVLLQKLFTNSPQFPTFELYSRYRSLINLNSLSFGISAGLFCASGKIPSIDIKSQPIEVLEVTGIFILASYLNHSCKPNLSILHPQYTKEVCFIAKKDIQSGEELTWQYYYHEDKKVRQKYLMENYFFHCSCPKCSEKS